MSSDSGSPKMSETSMIFGFSKSLEILSHHGIELIGNEVGPGSSSWILLSIEEPLWNVVLRWSGKDVGDGVDFFLGDFSGSLVAINLSNSEGKEGKSSTDTSNLSKTEWSLLFTGNVCVLHSQNMSELIRVL